jgi:hypothetical protein
MLTFLKFIKKAKVVSTRDRDHFCENYDALRF